MSDTPETDRQLHSDWVSADFARKLERERDEARKKLEALKDASFGILGLIPKPSCSYFHHSKKDRHTAFEYCHLVKRAEERIETLKKALVNP